MGMSAFINDDPSVIWDATGLPIAIRVFKTGDNPASDGLRAHYDPKNAQTIIDNCNPIDKMVAINIDHLHNYVGAPLDARGAAGWGKLEARADGIWLSSIEWVDEFADKLRKRTWRYSSAEFRVDEQENVIAVTGLALTHNPATFDAEPIVRNNITYRRSLTAATMPTVDAKSSTSIVKPMANNVNEAGATVAEPIKIDAKGPEVKKISASRSTERSADRDEDPKDGAEVDKDEKPAAALDLEKIDPEEVLKSPNALQLIEQLLDQCRDMKAAMEKMQSERSEDDDDSDDDDEEDDDDKAEAYDEERKELLRSLWSESRISSKQRREMKATPLRKIKEFAELARKNDAKVEPKKDKIVEKPVLSQDETSKALLRSHGYDPDKSNTVSETLAKAKQLHDRATKWSV